MRCTEKLLTREKKMKKYLTSIPFHSLEVLSNIER